MGGACSIHEERREMHTELSLENLSGRVYLVYLGVNESVILKWIVFKKGMRMWTGFIWLRSSVGLF
jgi:hypothetical protein